MEKGLLLIWHSIPRVNYNLCLTHIGLASHFWDIGKQWRPRSDAAERGVWSGSTLFAPRNFYQKYDKNEKSTADTSKNGIGLVQFMRVDGSTRQMRVNDLKKQYFSLEEC